MRYYLGMTTPEDELYNVLKVATQTGDDEGRVVPGTTQLYEDPPGIETAPPDDDNQSFSEGVAEESKKDREGVLDKAFVGKGNTDVSDQALIRENFAHGKPGQFVAHSTHLEGEEVKTSHPRAESLTEAVRRLL